MEMRRTRLLLLFLLLRLGEVVQWLAMDVASARVKTRIEEEARSVSKVFEKKRERGERKRVRLTQD